MNQKKISEMKSDFINNMTHEFKTPLATISVAADAIVNKKVIDDQLKVKHFVEIIKKENLRMNQQVETILQIARLDKSDFEFNFKVHDLHDLIDRAVQGMNLQVANRGGAIKVIKNASNSIVTCDVAHTFNLLSNLLDNANKYSTVAPQITIKTKNSSSGVWLAVSDKGIGMNKQVLQKIFERFYRVSSGNIHNVKGFGLGLSYVKAVVDANKGEIIVHSEPGKGSTFEVFFPFTMV
jgi:two-component system phosphate regulon sensor histidine kinase PhoR